jgi:hypothetical protein
MMIKDFGGFTTAVSVPSLIGWGARDPRKPRRTLELNKHAYYTVYAAALRASDEYFLLSRRNLGKRWAKVSFSSSGKM